MLKIIKVLTERLSMLLFLSGFFTFFLYIIVFRTECISWVIIVF